MRAPFIDSAIMHRRFVILTQPGRASMPSARQHIANKNLLANFFSRLSVAQMQIPAISLKNRCLRADSGTPCALQTIAPV
jgi:hypothetical protein